MKAKFYLFLLLVNSSINTFSQAIVWQNTIGGSNHDFFTSLQQTSDGGYILGGYSMSNISGDKIENCNSTDYWIIKTNATGDIQWQNTIGGNNADWLSSIQQTTDGGYILGGSSASNISGDKTENSMGNFDYWVVKIDSLGNIQWQNTIGGNKEDYLNSIKQTYDGGYILGGYSVSDISGDKTENCIGGIDYWIVKIDILGNIQWQNTIGGDTSDYLFSIQQTTDGGYFLGGYSYSNISGDKTENAIGNRDYWIVKTDSLGNIQWQNTIGGNDDDILNSVEQSADGGFILGGWSMSNISGDKTENSNGSSDYWIVKTNASGNVQWQNTIGGNNGDKLTSIKQTTDGGYILGGCSVSNISGDKMENNIGGGDYWIVKTDSSGNIQWQNTIGGSSGDALISIQQTADEDYILGGTSESNISGDKTENNIGIYEDYWIIKVTENYHLITGKLFIDANSNNVQDVGETTLLNKQVTEINTGRLGFSQNGGIYNINVLDSGNFTVSPSSINYYNSVPATHNAYFLGIHQIDSLNDFAFQPAGMFNDLCVTLTPMGSFRANTNANYMINYENVGTTTLNGTVIFFPDNDVTFVSSNPTATSVTTDSISWNMGTLIPFQTGNILVTVHVNAGTPIGTLIKSNVRIEPVAGDNYPGCNYSYWEVYTTAPVDPNAILIDRDTVLTTELSSPPYLNYIIYFQNTGNDTAFIVRVLNNIPQTLDVNSFELVASSHPSNINYSAASRLFTFTFDNINLPDSGANEPGSHGFIRYRIKPLSTLVAGDQIKNNAFIYFDFNQPVMTDTAVTEIVLPTGEEEFKVQSSKFKVFPNPVKDELIVSGRQSKEKGAIRIFDLYGREVFQLETLNLELETKINVSGFSQGVYIIELQSGEPVLRGKFLKE
jgi:hypothetical protein